MTALLRYTASVIFLRAIAASALLLGGCFSLDGIRTSLNACDKTNDCAAGQTCLGGQCRAACGSALSCSLGEDCTNGHCMPSLKDSACDSTLSRSCQCGNGARGIQACGPSNLLLPCSCEGECSADSCTAGCCKNNVCTLSGDASCGTRGAACTACSGDTPSCRSGECESNCTQDCGTGCCSANGCAPGTSDDSCGSGHACKSCAGDAAGRKCVAHDNGELACGCTVGADCASGSVCDHGTCAQKCVSGCSDANGTCQEGTGTDSCGAGGGLCQVCTDNQTCTAGGCTSVCNGTGASPCKNACCNGSVCQTPDGAHCGPIGSACTQSCNGSSSCSQPSGSCAANCDHTAPACGSGCCGSDNHCYAAGTSNTYCGTSGACGTTCSGNPGDYCLLSGTCGSGCQSDSECKGGTPYCNAGTCQQCKGTNTGCAGGVCSSGTCVQCTPSSGTCSGSTPDCVNNVCVECANSTECINKGTNKNVCYNGACVECGTAADCGSGSRSAYDVAGGFGSLTPNYGLLCHPSTHQCVCNYNPNDRTGAPNCPTQDKNGTQVSMFCVASRCTGVGCCQNTPGNTCTNDYCNQGCCQGNAGPGQNSNLCFVSNPSDTIFCGYWGGACTDCGNGSCTPIHDGGYCTQ